MRRLMEDYIRMDIQATKSIQIILQIDYILRVYVNYLIFKMR